MSGELRCFRGFDRDSKCLRGIWDVWGVCEIFDGEFMMFEEDSSCLRGIWCIWGGFKMFVRYLRYLRRIQDVWGGFKMFEEDSRCLRRIQDVTIITDRMRYMAFCSDPLKFHFLRSQYLSFDNTVMTLRPRLVKSSLVFMLISWIGLNMIFHIK